MFRLAAIFEFVRFDISINRVRAIDFIRKLDEKKIKGNYSNCKEYLDMVICVVLIQMNYKKCGLLIAELKKMKRSFFFKIVEWEVGNTASWFRVQVSKAVGSAGWLTVDEFV